MTVQALVENQLVHEPSGVWRLEGHRAFEYSDGADSERYLRRVFGSANDLGSRSAELEAHIKDWRSEYHLSTKRAQLLSGFSFDRGLRVAEVGCGCGAITRFLGESFDEVVAVEGSEHRARLARLRTRDLESVSILCAPFQALRFKRSFDVVFCIGVLEYAASFVDADDPYDAVLGCFADMVRDDGQLVLAIENQFGLKYFCGAGEDHLGQRFVGIEGYRGRATKVRTFGKVELDTRLRRHFGHTQFFYPYPDYKLPDAVVSAAFLASGRAAELISQFRSRDYTSTARPLWNEAATVFELARNDGLEFFANSFLVVASKRTPRGISFPQDAVFFSSRRRPIFRTRTRVVASKGAAPLVDKDLLSGAAVQDLGPLRLSATKASWIDGLSLHTTVLHRARQVDRTLADVFSPCLPWLEALRRGALDDVGVLMLDGEHVDTIWSNVYPADGQCRLIDREWTWREPVRLNAVVIRAIYTFLTSIDDRARCAKALQRRSGQRLIRDIASSWGLSLAAADFDAFVRLECAFQELAVGVDRRRVLADVRWYLFDRPSRRAFVRCSGRFAVLWRRIVGRFERLVTG